MYHAIRALEVKSQEEKSKGGGLLAPVKNFMKKKFKQQIFSLTEFFQE